MTLTEMDDARRQPDDYGGGCGWGKITAESPWPAVPLTYLPSACHVLAAIRVAEP